MLGLGAAGGLARIGTTRTEAEPSDPPDKAIIGRGSGEQKIVWSVDTDRPVASLTFDDGPDPDFTPAVLDILARYDVRATFMAMGHNALKNKAILRRMLAEGHEIGGHGWTHLNLTETSLAKTKSEIDLGTKLIEEAAGTRVQVFRPPYGRFDQATAEILSESQRDLVVWSVTRGDLGWKNPRTIAGHVIGKTGPGDIIDLHDGIGRGTFNKGTEIERRLRARRITELEALPRIVEGISARGIRLTTVSDLLAMRRQD